MTAYILGNTLGNLFMTSLVLFALRCSWKNWKQREIRDE
jgi:hypothetical protein